MRFPEIPKTVPNFPDLWDLPVPEASPDLFVMTRKFPFAPSATSTGNGVGEASLAYRSPVNAAITDEFSETKITDRFIKFLQDNPTVFHTVSALSSRLSDHGFIKLSERDLWTDKLKQGGKYYVTRNGSTLVAFTVGKNYKSGNGVAMIAGHIDALTARLKPIPTLSTKAGYVQLGVAPYAGGFNSTWWDRDLGIGGRVIIKDKKSGKFVERLVKLNWPIARIPTLAPHFGAAANGPFNKETNMVPIVGLDNSDLSQKSQVRNDDIQSSNDEGTFAATQPPGLVKAICSELGVDDYSTLYSWELELFDVQPAQLGGLEKEFLFAGRLDDKICSYAALEALLSQSSDDQEEDGIVKLAALFDDEEIGSQLRQGARGNLLPSVVGRISEAFAADGKVAGENLLAQTYANSFLVSADVTHAVNPNFLGAYLENHAPRLNVGVSIAADPNGHMTTDAVSTAILKDVAKLSGCQLQVFQIRNDSRSGGTVGPMLSSAMGVRAIDAGIVQLSMHSIRATTGSRDCYLGFKLFAGFYKHFEQVDSRFT
ncbi:MAG: hypothetical protein M1825_001791 [Sarcosagium campestre]|nr:MAG: hypothetical protein M1825_001791 [Sarcosagium campestre]